MFLPRLKVVDTDSNEFPPRLTSFRKETPEWIEKGEANSALWSKKVKSLIKSNRNRLLKLNLIRSNGGRWSLTRNGKNGAAGVLCERRKWCKKSGDGNTCWQPKSAVHEKVNYTGNLNVSSLGYSCVAWNDQSKHGQGIHQSNLLCPAILIFNPSSLEHSMWPVYWPVQL